VGHAASGGLGNPLSVLRELTLGKLGEQLPIVDGIAGPAGSGTPYRREWRFATRESVAQVNIQL
jgi:hypothetical protein